jgi:transcriptional regulator with XRE-family HTH domain
MNERFKALRLARESTQAELAALTCDEVQRATGHRPAVDAQAISRIERGHITWPGNATRAALRSLLGSDSDAGLGFFPKRTRREAEKEEATKRRDFLALAGIGLLDSGPERLSVPDVKGLSSRLARLRELDNFLGGADTFRLYGNELAHTERLLSHGTFGRSTRTELAALAAEQAQQAGWAAFDAGHTAAALRLYAYSHRAAGEADDQELAANALIQIAYATGQRDSVDAADAACRTVHPTASAKSRALLESRRAWSHAVAGDARNAAQALDAARQILATADAAPAPHWSSWVDATELDIMTGRVWAVLHDPSRAIPPLERALATFPDHWARDKALYLTWLADAHIDAGDGAEADAVTEAALALASRVASVRPLTRVREVSERLVVLGTPASRRLATRAAEVMLPIPAQL